MVMKTMRNFKRTRPLSLYLKLTILCVSFYFTSCSTNNDCLNMQAGYDPKTKKLHCCENALWITDLKNIEVNQLLAAIGVSSGGLAGIDISAHFNHIDFSNCRQLDNILATHFPHAHCKFHINGAGGVCGAEYVKDRIDKDGQITITNVSDADAGANLAGALGKLGAKAEFNASLKQVNTYSGHSCTLVIADHNDCGAIGIEGPPASLAREGFKYYYSDTLNGAFSAAARDSLKAFAKEHLIPTLSKDSLKKFH